MASNNWNPTAFSYSKRKNDDYATLKYSEKAVASLNFSEAYVETSDDGKWVMLYCFATSCDAVQKFKDDNFTFEPQPVVVPIPLENYTTEYNGNKKEHETNKFMQWLGIYLAGNAPQFFKGSIEFNALSLNNEKKLIDKKNPDGSDVDEKMVQLIVSSVLDLTPIEKLDKLIDLKKPTSGGSGGSGKDYTPAYQKKLDWLKDESNRTELEKLAEWLESMPDARKATMIELLKAL